MFVKGYKQIEFMSLHINPPVSFYYRMVSRIFLILRGVFLKLFLKFSTSLFPEAFLPLSCLNSAAYIHNLAFLSLFSLYFFFISSLVHNQLRSRQIKACKKRLRQYGQARSLGRGLLPL